jgi:hypothetical protein
MMVEWLRMGLHQAQWESSARWSGDAASSCTAAAPLDDHRVDRDRRSGVAGPAEILLVDK